MNYEVRVTRDGRWWVAVVTGVRGGATETRRLDQLDGEVRDLLSGLLDVDPDGIDLTWRYELSPAAQKALADYTAARDRLAEAQQLYEEKLKQAAGGLVAEDLSVRDAGYLLDKSFQRISQLTKAS